MIGRLHARASQMVPGPALVTITSEACIISDILYTKPKTFDGTCKLERERWRCTYRRLLRPVMMSNCTDSRAWEIEFTAERKPPEPSPPPTSKTTGLPGSNPNLRCNCSLLSSARVNLG